MGAVQSSYNLFYRGEKGDKLSLEILYTENKAGHHRPASKRHLNGVRWLTDDGRTLYAGWLASVGFSPEGVRACSIPIETYSFVALHVSAHISRFVCV